MSRGQLKKKTKSLNLMKGKGAQPGICMHNVYECIREKSHNFSGGKVEVIGRASSGKIMLKVLHNPGLDALIQPKTHFTVSYDYFMRAYKLIRKVCRGTRCSCKGATIPIKHFYAANKSFFYDGYQSTCINDKNASLHSPESKRRRMETLNGRVARKNKAGDMVPVKHKDTIPVELQGQQLSIPVVRTGGKDKKAVKSFMEDVGLLVGLAKGLEQRALYIINLEKENLDLKARIGELESQNKGFAEVRKILSKISV
jgi:hypothetical protein